VPKILGERGNREKEDQGDTRKKYSTHRLTKGPFAIGATKGSEVYPRMVEKLSTKRTLPVKNDGGFMTVC